MTKTQARRIASETLRLGYYRERGGFRVWVRCSRCDAWVQGHTDPRTLPEPVLRDAMIDHLYTWQECEKPSAVSLGVWG